MMLTELIIDSPGQYVSTVKRELKGIYLWWWMTGGRHHARAVIRKEDKEKVEEILKRIDFPYRFEDLPTNIDKLMERLHRYFDFDYRIQNGKLEIAVSPLRFGYIVGKRFWKIKELSKQIGIRIKVVEAIEVYYDAPIFIGSTRKWYIIRRSRDNKEIKRVPIDNMFQDYTSLLKKCHIIEPSYNRQWGHNIDRGFIAPWCVGEVVL